MRTLCKGIALSALLFSCNNEDGAKNDIWTNDNMENKKWEYTAIADGGNDYIFLYDKNLDLGDSTALLLDKKGKVLKNFKRRKEDNSMIVAGTFYKNTALLLSLNQKKLMLYEIATGNTYYSSVGECKDNFLLHNQFFLLNDSIALFVTAKDYGGSDYAGKNIIALNMKSGQRKVLAENIGIMYKSGDQIFFTKELKDIYLIDNRIETIPIAKINKNVVGLNGNTSYSGYLTWENLSERLNILLQKNLTEYSDRIYEYGEINDFRYKSPYFFELVDNKTNEVIFREAFPKNGYDIQSIKMLDKTHVLFNLFNRNTPAQKRLMLLTISNKQYHTLPENMWLLDSTDGYLILDGEKLGIYNLTTNTLNQIVNSQTVAEKYMNKGCCGFYYFVTSNTGTGCDFLVLDIENVIVKKIKHLSPQDLD